MSERSASSRRSFSSRLRHLLRYAEPAPSTDAAAVMPPDEPPAVIEPSLTEPQPAPAPGRATTGPQPAPEPDSTATEQAVPRHVEQSLASIEKQITRLGREQLKINTLFESQIEQQRAALEVLRAANERAERESAAAREQQRGAEQAARLDVARATLPAVDGLDEALRAGAALLERPRAPVRRGLFGRAARPAPASPGEEALREGMRAWLEGLQFVRRRLLDLLAAEGVRPMDADERPFDPHLHIALDVVPAVGRTPGTVVATLRQGYLAGDRVLRHAEVAVADDATVPDAQRAKQKVT